MADKSRQLVLDALQRAAVEPEGLPLFGGRASTGLFSTSQAGKLAAQECLQDGYLLSLSSGHNGRSPQGHCAITEKGLAHLLDELNPTRILEQLTQTLAGQQVQVQELNASATRIEKTTERLGAIVELVSQRIPRGVNGSPAWEDSIVKTLARWHSEKPSEDCPLPELFRQTQKHFAQLTPGCFHDTLRRHHDEGRIHLHPWTGPLYDLPEPVYALMAGHEVVYYASLRNQ